MSPVEQLRAAVHGCLEIKLMRFMGEGRYSIGVVDLDAGVGIVYIVNAPLRTFEHAQLATSQATEDADFAAFLGRVLAAGPAVRTEVAGCLVRLLVESPAAHPDTSGLHPRAFAPAKYYRSCAYVQLLFRSCVVRALGVIRTAHSFAADFRGLARRYRAGALIARRAEEAALSPYTRLGQARLLRDFAELKRAER